MVSARRFEVYEPPRQAYEAKEFEQTFIAQASGR
jgi:hypothetical protein